jgi:transposase
MPATSHSAIAIVGVDIGKNSFHVVGLDKRGAIILRQKWSRSGGITVFQHATLPGRLGSLRRCASSYACETAGPF